MYANTVNYVNRMKNSVNCVRSYCYKPIRRPNFVKKERPAVVKSAPDQQPSLAQQIQTRIRAGGPITVAQYMKYVLTHPSVGYYMHKDVFGQGGDFITSPEIGQIFGELVAVWLYVEWQKIGSPKPLQIVELGPGRGTLMQDILRCITKFGALKPTDLSIHLVEASPFLCETQARQLCYKSEATTAADSAGYHDGETISGIPICWYHKIEDIPRGFSVIVAHEFFDALPVHKFQRTDTDKWREILIDIDPAGDRLRFVHSPTETVALGLFLKALAPDECRVHIEYSLDSDQIIEHIAFRLEENGGFALVMDYGHVGDKSDTFRAFKNHQLHDALTDPGTADLTADVDFRQMTKVAQMDDRLTVFGPVTQGDFIASLKGPERLEMLIQSANANEVDNLKSGYELLTHPDKMGTRFKFLAMFPSVLRDHLNRFPVTGF